VDGEIASSSFERLVMSEIVQRNDAVSLAERGEAANGEGVPGFGRASCWAALVVLAAVFSIRFALLPARWFNPDEFEHVHAAWCVGKGMAPYRDFFEHHTPWFYYVLAPLVHGVGTDGGSRSAAGALVLARWGSLVFAAGALGALVWVGRLWAGMLAGLSAAALLATMPMFLEKTVEVRPDVPALMLWLACLAWLARGIQPGGARVACRPGATRAGQDAELNAGPSGRTRAETQDVAPTRFHTSFFIAGLCLGGAIMFTQKMLFTLPGLGVAGLAWACLGGRRGAARGSPAGRCTLAWRLAALAWFAVGLFTPFLLTWGWFAAHGAGFAFIQNNFLLNARWKAAEAPQPFLQYILRDSWPVVALAAGGILLLWFNLLMRKSCDWLGLLFLLALGGLLLGLLLIPVAMAQYYLMLLPLVALFAGRFLVFLAGLAPRAARWPCHYVAMVLLQLSPMSRALDTLNWRNEDQLRQIDFVLAHSGPNEMVMDGWRGFGVFRPHAWYYYFLHPEVRGMLPPAELAAFLGQLESGNVKPKFVVMDNNLRALPERFNAFVKTHYEEGPGDIWIRKREP